MALALDATQASVHQEGASTQTGVAETNSSYSNVNNAVQNVAVSTTSVAFADRNAIQKDPSPRERSRFPQIDDEISQFLSNTNIPGAACAIFRQGKLLYAQGFGYTDIAHSERVTANTLFRIASVSKALTATGIMRLFELGKFQLDTPVLDVIKIRPISGKSLDPNLKNITVRNLLDHRSGFGSSHPSWPTTDVAKELGKPLPVSRNDMIQVALSKPLEFGPGSKYVYQNLNYYVLAHVIECVTGEKYEGWVKRNLLEPIGITRMFCISSNRFDGRKLGETRYYDLDKQESRSINPEDSGRLVPLMYGGIDYTAIDGGGGWVGSVTDLARFFCALEGYKGRILSGKTLQLMSARPAGETASTYHASSFEWRDDGDSSGFGITGAMPGVHIMVINRAVDGITFVIMCNGNNKSGGIGTGLIQKFHDAINRAKAARQLPSGDLFEPPKSVLCRI